ncbi:division/cell wall cluster transcriptional repressor MraZ [Hymenobacter sp. BT559]|jgi:MraZ protein|uniref:division/cell wall cluster transcriptional repressor MraZ n=1 Tax=Hymenobacter sp. BT559 TaxID=2795729 RepID=UPI0018EAFB70|nr:division/cell wall cluster transcriptional repressor MraZ [Hymenobacter sp. BT559]MBJ6145117.1 division/cell wall cluster transcriptional repressor MraZ [Hymenobacter sp. BT559]
MSLSLTGEYDCKLDPKGRLVLPAKVKAALPDAYANQLVLVRGLEPCLVLYPRSAWDVIQARVMALDEFNEEYRQFQRNFLRGVTEVELDNIGRFLLPGSMRRYAGLEKEAIIVGLGNRCELWDPTRYDDYLIKDPGEFSKLAQKFVSLSPDTPGSPALSA